MSHRISTPTKPAALSAIGARALALSLALLLPSTGSAQVGPEESARKLKPADGLEATLWAAEPMVLNPTNIDIDSRGRVWVTEGLNYRLLAPGRNKPFERIEGADKIKILEDTDGDGKADKVTVFADNIFPIPMGIAVEEHYGKDGKYQGCKVFIGNSPDLLVLEDTDGDDKADKRYPLLTGFGGIDSDHGVHGMVLGLDGKLYFTHGDGCCSVQQDHSQRSQNFDVVDKSGRHVSSDQLANTLRVNRDGTQFEVLADRQRNNYETSLNSFGNIFTSDNDDDGNRGCRVIWIMDGGHYGYHTPGSPRHWGEDVPGNVPKLVGTGNGSPCGLMVYEGSLLPKEYMGGILEAEAGTRQINFFPVTRQGASFRVESKVLLASDDPWFRPVDATAAPDGSVFVADWYDAGVGGHGFRDQTTGRIYRVAPKGSKTKAVKVDFSTVHGLIEALKSPVVATRDTARRLLIDRAETKQEKPEEVASALVNLYTSGDPSNRARALWVLGAVTGDKAALAALKDTDPRIREQAVRMLGRDDRENGRVEYKDETARRPAPALAHLDDLLPMASDSDAGVRRELSLALRKLPTDKVGEPLKTLARTWDGQDRWYLEALGLALQDREKPFLAELFDGTLYGDLDLENSGQASRVALPPYFPVDRNESYIEAGTKDLPASPLSKTLGLVWRLRSVEALPMLGRVLPKLATPELQSAADDILKNYRDPETATVVAALSAKADDPAWKRQVLATLTRKLDGDWRDARTRPEVVEAAESALKDPELKVQGIALAAATGDARYAGPLMDYARDAKAPAEVRAAAVEAVARLKAPKVGEFLDALIAEVKGKTSSSPTADAAIRALAVAGGSQERLSQLLGNSEYPLGLRREALRQYASTGRGAMSVLGMARSDKLLADLKTEASVILNSSRDRSVRGEAAKLLPLPKARGGRPLPSISDLITRTGQADRGRAVFFRTGPNLKDRDVLVSCGACHRVQGQGQWIGPDLSTIGTKYGKEELLRSILNPSAAIGYNFRTNVVVTRDGRVFTGLAVEDTPDRLVLKTSEGVRVVVNPRDIEERAGTDVSLMPEGLAETMSDQELVDLLAFLSALRSPVSVVGQYQVIGPLAEANGTPAFDVTRPVDPSAKLRDPEGRPLSWRRLDANAEGLADLTALASEPSKTVYARAPIVSPIEQEARLVLDSKADLKAWLNGKPVALPPSSEDQPRAVVVELPKGRSDLLIRVAGGPSANLVTTLVADRPLEFRADEAKVSAR